MKECLRKSRKGQATVEYIILLSILSMLSVSFVKWFYQGFGKTVGGLGHSLTRSLRTGVCEKDCYYNGFKNQGDH
jgi:hypothetical protein